MLKSCGWSIEMLGYASNLLNIHYKLQKNKDLYKLKSIDFFPEQTSVTLRKLVQCIGIKNSHKVLSKDEWIRMITCRHAELKHEPDIIKMTAPIKAEFSWKKQFNPFINYS